MTVRLRAMTLEDLPEVLSFMETFNRHEQIPWRPVEMRQGLERLMADETIGLARVIVADTERVGYLLITFGFDLEFGGRDAFLTELFIAERARNRGLAARALALAEAEAEAHGVHALHLQVRPDNHAARALYQRRGFAPIPRLLLSKRLA